MCGITGYVGYRNASDIILENLRRLAYRGYDSAGIAVIEENQIQIRRAVGKLTNLEALVKDNPVYGKSGIGHTRWATHGSVTIENAHPQSSGTGDLTIVHNGIVENYQELKRDLQQKGVPLQSQTDTEIIAHLIQQCLDIQPEHNLQEAVCQAAKCLKGAQAIVVLSRSEPDKLIAARIGNAGGLIVGHKDGEAFVASDGLAIAQRIREVTYLESHQCAVVTAKGYLIQDLHGSSIHPVTIVIDQDAESSTGEYDHFMQKEIFEQAEIISNIVSNRVDLDQQRINIPELRLSPKDVATIENVVTVACGTSYYSGLIGKFYLEGLAQIPTQVDYASEYRYRNPLTNNKTAVLGITQSGETADTLAALNIGKSRGAKVWTIANVPGSQAVRLSDGNVPMNAGPEIGVASTKTFIASIACQYLLALKLAEERGALPEKCQYSHVKKLTELPALIRDALMLNQQIRDLATNLVDCTNFLFIGRGLQYPVAMEGALKLKEISYIHAEGYPAGEMKHGPIALIDKSLPVVAIAVQDALYEKMLSQIEQAKARGARIIAIATEGDQYITTIADEVLYVPKTSDYLYPMLTIIPLQLLAYHVAVLRRLDVDHPRNLAKSVTVE